MQLEVGKVCFAAFVGLDILLKGHSQLQQFPADVTLDIAVVELLVKLFKRMSGNLK